MKESRKQMKLRQEGLKNDSQDDRGERWGKLFHLSVKPSITWLPAKEEKNIISKKKIKKVCHLYSPIFMGFYSFMKVIR